MRGPKVDVHAHWDQADSSLTIEIENDGKWSGRAANEKKADAIRKLINEGSFGPRTRAEGGSGFLKIAAVVAQSDKGRIEFGYTEEGRFRLSVTYALDMHIQEDTNEAE